MRRITDLPVAAGFGISRPEHLRTLRGQADAAVVASALLDRIHRGEDPSSSFGGTTRWWSSTTTWASPAPGWLPRSGFARMRAEVALGQVGLVLGLEVSRLARNNADWRA